ncbi:MAG: RluA family pseudouridine synthase [Brumimicrobium sp.]|nr:RluA family pseudouridine synthase [Brumimicrobium sp.]MCO5268380.1 RluA family pseudouridine synthase [Brumimicrobium sp.]
MLDVIYEDNHLIAVNKAVGDIVQGDKTGDTPLPEEIKSWLAEKYNKPGNVFCGVIHRLDRPTSGIVIFSKTSKALSRMNALFKTNGVQKTYWAIVEEKPPNKSGTLRNYLVKNEKQNKSYVTDASKKDAKEAILDYRLIAESDNYYLLEIALHTGRHHQIRAQLAHIGCHIKGDLKYGAKRANKDGGISLHARKVVFEHPIKKEIISITAKVPNEPLWKWFEENN